MARFMLVTFFLLGWSFYELSGGADFVPPEPEPRPLNALLEQVAEEDRSLVTRAATAPSQAQILGVPRVAEEPVPITLARYEGGVIVAPDLAGEPLPEVVEVAVEPVAVEAPLDLRVVTGSRVNMRSGPGTSFAVLTQLVEGDEAEVLQSPGNGWVKLRALASGSEGWMAESLLARVN